MSNQAATAVNALPMPAQAAALPERVRAITAASVVWTLLALDGLILMVAGAHSFIGSPSGFIAALFSLDYEPTIPGWYASVKLLLVASLLVALAASLSCAADRKRLIAAALLFLVMSCDESAAIHERLQRAIDDHVLAGHTNKGHDSLILAKVVVGFTALAVVAAIVLMLVTALRRIGGGTAGFGLGLLLLAAGAVGVDLTFEFFPSSETGTALAILLEETLEMIGVTLMVYGALRALAVSGLVLHFGAEIRSGPA